MNRKNLTELVARWTKQADDIEPDVPEDQPWDNHDEAEDAAVADIYRECAAALDAELTNKGKTFYQIHFDGEGFRTLATYRLFFKAALQGINRRAAEYDAEVSAWYEENPGYQFPHCIHGSSLTTDYDNICGGCEDWSTPLELAIIAARTDYLRFVKAWEWATDAPNDLPREVREDLVLRAWKLFPTKTEEV